MPEKSCWVSDLVQVQSCRELIKAISTRLATKSENTKTNSKNSRLFRNLMETHLTMNTEVQRFRRKDQVIVHVHPIGQQQSL